MFVIAFTTFIACMSTLTSADWKLRALNEYSSVISMEQRRFNKEVMIMSLAEDRSLESLTSMDNGASWKTTTIPKQDYTVTSNASKDRLNFENLPFNFETKEISPFGETGVAVTGRFHYLHSEDMFNGIAVKADITSNSWRVFSLSTNTTEADQLLFATHSSFPTKETWYTVLSTVPTEKQKKGSTNAFSHFDVKTGEFMEMNHPLSVEKQDALPSNKQFLAVYKTSNSGNDWDKILEVKEDFNSYMQDFQCFDDVTCVALIQRLDQTAVILMTKDGGMTWSKIYENKDTKKELKSLFLQSHENFWVVVEGLSKEGKVQSMLLHTVFAGEAWNDDITIPEVEGWEKIFFYKGGVGATDDDYRYVEGLIISKTKEGKQMIQQIVAEL